MIGLRTGPKTLIGGPAAGLSADPFGTGGFTTKDATSLKAVPLTTSEYRAAGFNAPYAVWGMQDASGNILDAVGSTPLTPASILYQQTVSGWTRKALTWVDGGVTGIFSTDAGLPDVSTTAMMVLVYYAVTAAPAADRTCIICGNSNGARFDVTSTRVPKMLAGVSGASTATGAQTLGSTVHPFIIKVDSANSIQKIYTDLETVTPTFSAMSSAKGIFISGSAEVAPATAVVYGALWQGANAQMTDTTIRSMLQGMGWTVAW